MRIPAFTLAILLCGAGLASTQQPVAQQPPQQPGVTLEAALGQWERAMGGMNALDTQVSRTKVDKVFASTEVYEGRAKFLKPNKASLYLEKKGKPEIFEKIVCDGAFLFLFDPQQKQIQAHKLPPPQQGQPAGGDFLSLLFGMKAADAKNRYDLKLLQPPPNDQWYHYIEVVPRLPADQAEFRKARLVLNKTNGLPRQLWFVEANGNEITWDFGQMQTDAKLAPQEFAQPTPPAGWQMRVMPNQPARVIRP